MKLSMVSTFNVRCGLATYTAYLAEELKKQGIDITVLAEKPFPDESALTKDFKPDVPFIYCWNRTELYHDLVKEANKYDLIHIQHQYGLFNNEQAFTWLLNSIKARKIITIHDIVPPNEQLFNYFMATFSICEKMIVHTQACYDMLLRWDCPKEKIALIPHGTKLIDVPSKEEARKALGLPLDSKIILSWGFIWESKGIIEIISVFKEILKTYPNAIFIHVGGVHPIIKVSDYLRNILRSAMKSGLTPNNFKITQWVPEDKVPIYFGASDLIVLNYMRGSVSASGAAHRAMASHRPLVGTDDSCLEDIPKYTIMRFDINSLYKGILKVLGDKTLQDDLVKKQDLAALETSWENIAKKHREIY